MAITITSNKAPAPANANAASTDAAQPTAGAEIFAALLGAELTQLGSGGDGAQAKLDTTDPKGLKTAKDDKSADASGKPVDPSALAFLQAVVPTVAPVNVPVVQQADANLNVDSQLTNTVQASVATTVQATEDNSFLLGSPLKKLDEQQKLPLQAADFAQFMPQGQTGNVAQTNTKAVTLAVPVPMQDPEWGKAFGNQMLGMVSLKADTAHIQVNPPELGPIDVTLKIDNNNQAQVSFVTSNPMAREIVETHMPRLTSMLAAGGIQLTGSQVSTGQGNQQQAQQQQQQRNQRDSGVDEIDTLAVIKAARGVLSIFA